MVTQLESSSYSGITWYSDVSDSSLLQGTITSIGMLGALFGSLICFQVADDLGRRRTILIASALFVVGSTIECISGDSSYSFASGVSLLLFGRITYG